MPEQEMSGRNPIAKAGVRLLSRLLPRQVESLKKAFGNSAYPQRLQEMVTKRYGKTILAGPFVGMTYVDQAVGSALPPKLLGSYEIELKDVIETLIAKNYSIIIDVGCAEGYYAVGMARRCQDSVIQAYDTEPLAQQLCRKMAIANGVSERVHIGGTCDAAVLNGQDLTNALLICDCEGYELELLQPDLVPGLKKCDILVELHEGAPVGLTQAVLKRFETTHEIHVIDTQERKPEDYPLVACFPKKHQWAMLSEFRGVPMQWAMMTAK